MREVVCCNARDLFAPETGLRAESKGNLLLRRLRLIDESSDLVVLFGLVEPDTLRIFALRIVVEANSSIYWLRLQKTM